MSDVTTPRSAAPDRPVAMLPRMTKRTPAGPIVVALFLMACSSAAQSSAPALPSESAAASASASVAPSAGESPSAAPTPAGAQVREGSCCIGFALEPGRYASPSWFAIPLSLEVGTDWRAFRVNRNLTFTFVRGSNAVGSSTHWMSLFAPETSQVEAFLADLRATPLLTVGGGVPEVTEVGGYAAEMIDAVAQPNPAESGNDSRMPGTVDVHAMYRLHSLGITDFEWYTESAEARLRFVFVEVGDHTLIIYLEAPAAEFDAFMQLVDGVLDSIEIVLPT